MTNRNRHVISTISLASSMRRVARTTGSLCDEKLAGDSRRAETGRARGGYR